MADGHAAQDVGAERGPVGRVVGHQLPGPLPLPHDGHFGLFGMRERVQKLGAQLQIQSHLGEGTRIEVIAPLQSHALAIT